MRDLNKAQELLSSRAKVEKLIKSHNLNASVFVAGIQGDTLEEHQFVAGDILAEGYFNQVKQLKGMAVGAIAYADYIRALVGQTQELKEMYYKSEDSLKNIILYHLIRRDSASGRERKEYFDKQVKIRRSIIQEMKAQEIKEPKPRIHPGLMYIVKELYESGHYSTRAVARATATGKYSAQRIGGKKDWMLKRRNYKEGQVLEFMDLNKCDYNMYRCTGYE
jgi:hypothetical protein